MSREDFVAVAVRLFAIYLLIGILKHVPGAVQLFSQPQGIGWAIAYVVMLSIALLVCALLWRFPVTVARNFLPVMREPRSERSLDSSVAMSVGLTLIGVWVMAYGISDAIYWLTLFARSRQIGVGVLEWQPDQIADMAATAVELALATWLIFGSTGIKRLIYRYRFEEPPGAP
ncbi:hypothetical protein IAI53_07285 [Thauera sp. CAU 1555]|uniref:Uncharacterized protein n=1 Tax=Thauera sedimentorum TaxID=2767595 RepID=A0ABR9BBT1_9RHOO|nr:hypothetical protein [Thauera sedimentorum]MBC9071767.1 hypothetical protein [Thauera sedimentorum]MBD8502686.1 hypothetical protein [Thauera sedimentorum]